MDLGTRPRSTAALLSRVGARIQARDTLLIEEWQDIVTWAGDHVVATPEGAATITDGYLDTGVPIAGDGAPLVSEFGLMELVAVLGRSPDGGRAYVGRVIECAWRLPTVYAAVMAGRLTPWRAERIADLTHALSAEAAGFVDRQLFHASGVGWAQLDRLIAEAILRFDPERAEAERATAADQRYVEVGTPTPTATPTGSCTSPGSSTPLTGVIWMRRSPAAPVCSGTWATTLRSMCGARSRSASWPGRTSRSIWRVRRAAKRS
ncbi:hypothetical protein [Nocardioides humi]|uniref:hypothetical protein n=1 Tax=Nocardioides humi TaxID=449461 RepID=UPI0011278935|nr:hypothetical protein [Nocardioides humi]